MIRRSRSLSWRSYLCFLDIIDGLYSSSAHPAVIVLQRRNALYAYPYFAGGIKATCEFSSKWSSENGQNASTNIPYYLRNYIEGFPCVPRNYRRAILLDWRSPTHPTVIVRVLYLHEIALYGYSYKTPHPNQIYRRISGGAQVRC